MSAGAGPWARWVALWATRETGTALALFRIAIGLVCLHTVVDAWHSGIETWVWVGKDEGGIANVSGQHWLVQLLGGPGLDTTWRLMGMATAGCISVVLGLGHRLGALVALQAFIAIFSLNASSGGGHDRLITNALWLLALAPASETLSLWCRLRTGRWTSDRPVLAFVRYLGVIQLAVMYGMTGIQKLGSAWFPWGDLSAVYRAMLMPTWARADWSAVAWVYPLTQVATVVTWVWEVSWPVVLFAMWARRTRTRPGWLRALCNRLDVRTIYVLTGIGMHGTVETLMNVGPFSIITMAWYICCFHPDELHRWGRGIARRFGRARLAA